MIPAANNNSSPAPPMTDTQISNAIAFCLFDLLLMGVLSHPGAPLPLIYSVYIALWIYAALLAAEVYHSASIVINGQKLNGSSQFYISFMENRPMPPMIMSAVSVGMILCLAVFSFRYTGIVGLIPSWLLIYAGLTSAWLYVLRMQYHASSRRQEYHGKETPSHPSHPEKDNAQGTKPYSSGVGGKARPDR